MDREPVLDLLVLDPDRDRLVAIVDAPIDDPVKTKRMADAWRNAGYRVYQVKSWTEWVAE